MTTLTSRARRSIGGALLVVALAWLAGCATPDAKSAGQRLDPWENWNRKVFSFNEALDEKVLRPVAVTYGKVVPRLIRVGIDNFFNNARDAWSGVNNLLQAKFGPAVQDLMRVGTNTFLGFGGVLDWASEIGFEHHYEDFGQTLGRWGVGPGAFMMLPVLGPSTVRDTVVLPLDRLAAPEVWVDNGGIVTGLTALHLVNTRAGLLQATDVVNDIAIDKYTFIRDAYLQRRHSLVLDGEDAGAGDYAPAEEEPKPGATKPAR